MMFIPNLNNNLKANKFPLFDGTGGSSFREVVSSEGLFKRENNSFLFSSFAENTLCLPKNQVPNHLSVTGLNGNSVRNRSCPRNCKLFS
jgi:hypothetical protein